MGLESYKELDVWVKAMDVATGVYAIARQMPKQEEYRLTAQLIRAAVSVPANIAEGHARATRKEYAHFVSLLAEVEAVSRMLNRLHARLTNSPTNT